MNQTTLLPGCPLLSNIWCIHDTWDVDVSAKVLALSCWCRGRPCLLPSVGTAEAVSAPPAPLQPVRGQPQSLTVYSQPLCACATDFHLVRTQCTEHRAEQDNIDLQSHISGRVVWLLSQDNHVQWGFLGVVQHDGQSHSEGPIIRREGPSILYTHITLGVHTQPETSESQPKIFVVW